jgi:transposase
VSNTDHKHMSEADHVAGRRLEIFTGAGRRRSWSGEDKAAIVSESYAGTTSVCDVARRHGLTPSQLFTWRREARLAADPPPPRLFVEAVVDPASVPEPVRPRASPDGASAQSGIIEVEIDGVMVRVGRGADARTIAAVLRALKSTS